METKKDLNYYKANAEENYITTPISVLRYITELEQALQLQQTDVMCCVGHVEGITIDKVYKIVGLTNDKQMYVIDNDYGVYSCYGVDLFKHST